MKAIGNIFHVCIHKLNTSGFGRTLRSYVNPRPSLGFAYLPRFLALCHVFRYGCVNTEKSSIA